MIDVTRQLYKYILALLLPLVRWFHPTLTRHQAEAELTSSEEGVYLLRPRTERRQAIDGRMYSLDVRSIHSVKHFKVRERDGKLLLGEKQFHDMESFQEFFSDNPVFRDETGQTVTCQYPYPRDIDEIHDYYLLSQHFIPTNSQREKIEKSLDLITFSLGSKEGYLMKVGQRYKTWKRRWFVLRESNLCYYATEKDAVPIKTIQLKEASEVCPCEIPDRPNSFQIVLPYRTFYMQAPSQQIMEEWLKILEFKLNEVKEAEKTRIASLTAPKLRVSCTW